MREAKAREVMHKGKLRWRVIIPQSLNSGKTARRYFTGKHAKAMATKFAEGLEAMRAKAGVRLMALPQEKQVAMMHAADTTGDRLIEFCYSAGSFMAKKKAKSVPLGKVVVECISEKSKRNLSRAYIAGIRSTLERFALGKEMTPMDEITAVQIRDWIERLKEPVSQKSELIDLRTLFSYAERNYGIENVAKLVPFPKVIGKEPGIFTVEQVKTLLCRVHEKQPEMMRFVALALFAGVRPDEAQRLKPDCVTDGYIVVPVSVVKGNRRRRLVKVNDAFLAWWNLGGTLPVKKWQVQRVRDLVQPWPHDALRHSFVSYHSALFGEVETATAAGHSVRISETHYKATVTRESATDFWSLRPETVLTAVAKLPEFTG